MMSLYKAICYDFNETWDDKLTKARAFCFVLDNWTFCPQ